jgi:hypothetical protein
MMPAKILRDAIVFAMLAFTCASLSPAFAQVQRVTGKAFNLKGGLEYSEEHVLTYENDRIVAIKTAYFDADSRKIASQVSEFTHGPQFGSYDFKDERHQYNDGARVMADRILLYAKKEPGADTKRKYLAKKADQIVGQGFYQFVAANLDALAQGRSVSAKLVLPAQMNQYDVKIRKQNLESNRLRLVVELDNWFLRLFTPNVQIEYDLGSRRLLWYRGISMVPNKDNKNVEVVTTYDYLQPPSLLGSRSGQGLISSSRN